MTIDPATMDADELQATIHQQIPLARAMDLRVSQFDEQGLTLTAPLAPNRNDKATAFAGSLAALACLVGWGVARELAGKDSGFKIAITQSDIDFHLPVENDLEATCAMPDTEAAEVFRRALREKGKARITLTGSLRTTGGEEAVSFSGTYAAFRD